MLGTCRTLLTASSPPDRYDQACSRCPDDLARAVPEVSAAEARKIVAAVHHGEPVAASSAVRRIAPRAAAAAGHVPELAVVAETASAIDPFVKYLLAATDDARFEAVRIAEIVPAQPLCQRMVARMGFTPCVAA